VAKNFGTNPMPFYWPRLEIVPFDMHLASAIVWVLRYLLDRRDPRKGFVVVGLVKPGSAPKNGAAAGSNLIGRYIWYKQIRREWLASANLEIFVRSMKSGSLPSR
jgi:hypothetical protein